MANVIGGTSAEACLKTVKLASTGYLDDLPADFMVKALPHEAEGQQDHEFPEGQLHQTGACFLPPGCSGKPDKTTDHKQEKPGKNPEIPAIGALIAHMSCGVRHFVPG